MLILSRVCVDFHDTHGNPLFSIKPDQRLTFLEAPDTIQQDPIFQMLLDDGSLEASLNPIRRHQLEQDPVDGAEASGRRPGPTPTEAPEKKPSKARTRAGKADASAPAEEGEPSTEADSTASDPAGEP